MQKKNYGTVIARENISLNNGGSSRRVLGQSELEKIAKRDGFVFDRALSLGNTLYINNRKKLKRIYDKYGGIVNTYVPKCSSQNTSGFHNPVGVMPMNLYLAGVNQYIGRSQRVE